MNMMELIDAYAAAAAAQARVEALDEAKWVCIAEHVACWKANAIAASMAAQRCAAAIESLKGKP